MADQCPGGTLLYRFWEDWQNDGFFSVGEDDAIQEWGANAIVTRDIDCKTSHEYVDVRCSTRPGWVSKTQVSWQVNLLPDVIVGDLGALRASEGQFDGTVSSCLLNSPYRFGTPVPGFTHVDTPEPGEAFYYLVK